MIKSALKVAVCGLVAAVISAPAFANSPAAVTALQETSAGKQFISQVLKLKPTATSAEILAKINSLSAQETAAVTGAITVFNQSLKPYRGNLAQRADAKKANEALAASIFTQNNQAIQLAALTQKYASNVSVDSAVAGQAAQCSSVLDPSKMAANTKVSFATAEAVINGGYLLRGKCSENPENMESSASKENALQVAEFAMQNEALKKQGKARLAIYGQGLIAAQADDNSELAIKNQAAAEEAILKISNTCGWFPVSAQ